MTIKICDLSIKHLGGCLLFGAGLLLNTSVLANSAEHQNQATASSDEDLVILSQLSRQGGQNLPFPSTQSSAQSSTQDSQANSQDTMTPRTSSAAEVSHDKLVLNSPVIDEAGILTAGEKAHLESQLQKIYQDNLAQMAVVLVPTTGNVDIFDYAMATANRWGLGQKDTDDGILMLVAINDRKLQIVTGYGVEGVLPDAALKRIIREDITPTFKSGQYAEGISAGIARIDERLRADPEILAQTDAKAAAKASNTNSGSVDVLGLFVFAIILGTVLTGILGRFLGASASAGGFVFFAFWQGIGLISAIMAGLVLWLFLLLGGLSLIGRSGVRIGGSGGRHGGFGGGSGGFGSGGFGSGGFGGGGGSFGGGGAGGSW